MLTAAPVHGADDGSAPLVRYADGRLSVRLERVPLDQVMAAVERETGAVVHGQLLDWREVSKRFEDLPLGRALARLLGRQNFILWYDADGRPIRIELLGLPQPPPPKDRRQRPAPSLATVVAREPAVPLTPALQSVLGRPAVRFIQVLTAAVRQSDAALRGEARRIVLDAFERRATLRDALQRSTPDEIARFLRPWPAAHVDGLLREIRLGTHDPALRRIALQAELALRRARVSPTPVAGSGVPPRPGG